MGVLARLSGPYAKGSIGPALLSALAVMIAKQLCGIGEGPKSNGAAGRRERRRVSDVASNH